MFGHLISHSNLKPDIVATLQALSNIPVPSSSKDPWHVCSILAYANVKWIKWKFLQKQDLCNLSKISRFVLKLRVRSENRKATTLEPIWTQSKTSLLSKWKMTLQIVL